MISHAPLPSRYLLSPQIKKAYLRKGKLKFPIHFDSPSIPHGTGCFAPSGCPDLILSVVEAFKHVQENRVKLKL